MITPKQNFSIVIIIGALLLLSSCESSKEKAKKHLDAGIELTAKSDLEGALLEFNEAVRYDPENAETWYNRGITYYNLYEVEKALADYDKALEINPDHLDVLVNRGNARVYNGDIDGGCKDWKKAKSLGKKGIDHKLRYCK